MFGIGKKLRSAWSSVKNVGKKAWRSVKNIGTKAYRAGVKIGRAGCGAKYPNYRPGFPGEKHIPCYNYCGPGTHYDERIKRGDKGVTALDTCCKAHDKVYNASNQTDAQILAADEKLRKCALKYNKESKGRNWGKITADAFVAKNIGVDTGLVRRDLFTRTASDKAKKKNRKK